MAEVGRWPGNPVQTILAGIPQAVVAALSPATIAVLTGPTWFSIPLHWHSCRRSGLLLYRCNGLPCSSGIVRSARFEVCL
ncbi:MAG: hypothetical protein ACP5NN_04955 [Methanolinea sp.]